MGKPKQITTKDLLQSARQQLIKNGQGKITLKNVAETAGVTQGVVYYHFKSKDRLLISLLEEVMGKELLHIQELQKDKNPQEALKSLISEEMYKAQISSEQHQLLFELVSLSFHNKEMRSAMGQAFQKRLGLLYECTGEKEMVSRLLLAIMDGLALQALFDPAFREKEAYELAKKWILSLREE
ncbi:TetR/AcrR family transcriptional regulator [Ammoniphilus sp. YIM 78166]|uniref:TetR/AcrR family transcriptional regulator n=1 Tax=Ammoniphilus sp. YIM 78166 TaxID=1644106 RepID=UPI00106F343C|nr:TetR/AcrR family transcriptional regulator [Ammoniphilus sp. YIM 78166]